MTTKTAVVILNWNGIKLLQEFIPILIANTNSTIADLWVIDNASTDNSIEYLKNYSQINIIQLDKNYGFAEGYNRGLKNIEAKYYLLLNSDIEVPANWLEPLYSLMENDNNIAVCGPKILDYYKRKHFEYAGAAGGFIDKYAYPFCRGRVFENVEKDIGQYDSLIDCMWVGGAALMVRANLYKKINGFDELFFAHQEEIDLCWRLQNLGYRIVCQPQSFVYHVGGGTLNKSNPRKTFYNFRNNLFLIKKNFPKRVRQKVFFVRFFLDIVAMFRMFLQGLPKDAINVVKAYYDFYKKSKLINTKRKLIKPKSVKYLKGFYPKSIVFQNYIYKKIKS